MKCAIEELWNGKVVSAENCGVGDPRIEELVIMIEKQKDQLYHDIGQQQKTDLEKYTDCVDEYIYLITKRAFCEGFSLGSRLVVEALFQGN